MDSVYTRLPHSMAERHGSRQKAVTKFLVDGFPVSFSNRELKQLFEVYGEVGSVTIVTDQTGRSLGFGYVDMAFPGEAHEAQSSLNLSKLEDQRLLVIEVKETTGS